MAAPPPHPKRKAEGAVDKSDLPNKRRLTDEDGGHDRGSAEDDHAETSRDGMDGDGAPNAFDLLPDEIVLHLFGCCGLGQVGALACASRRLARLARDERFWRAAYLVVCPPCPPHVACTMRLCGRLAPGLGLDRCDEGGKREGASPRDRGNDDCCESDESGFGRLLTGPLDASHPLAGMLLATPADVALRAGAAGAALASAAAADEGDLGARARTFLDGPDTACPHMCPTLVEARGYRWARAAEASPPRPFGGPDLYVGRSETTRNAARTSGESRKPAVSIYRGEMGPDGRPSGWGMLVEEYASGTRTRTIALWRRGEAHGPGRRWHAAAHANRLRNAYYEGRMGGPRGSVPDGVGTSVVVTAASHVDEVREARWANGVASADVLPPSFSSSSPSSSYSSLWVGGSGQRVRFATGWHAILWRRPADDPPDTASDAAASDLARALARHPSAAPGPAQQQQCQKVAQLVTPDGWTAYRGHVHGPRCMPHGRGVVYDRRGNVLYAGEMRSGSIKGAGTVHLPDGSTVYSARWTHLCKFDPERGLCGSGAGVIVLASGDRVSCAWDGSSPDALPLVTAFEPAPDPRTGRVPEALARATAFVAWDVVRDPATVTATTAAQLGDPAPATSPFLARSSEEREDEEDAAADGESEGAIDARLKRRRALTGFFFWPRPGASCQEASVEAPCTAADSRAFVDAMCARLPAWARCHAALSALLADP